MRLRHLPRALQTLVAEDPSSFFRKGVVGDWRNVFTERDKYVFKEEAGDLLIKLGYEEDSDW